MKDTQERRKEIIDFIHRMLKGPWEKRSRVTEALQPIVDDYGLGRATFAWHLNGNRDYDCVKFSSSVHIGDIANAKHGGSVRDLIENYKAIVALSGADREGDLSLGYVTLRPAARGCKHIAEWDWYRHLYVGSEVSCEPIAVTVEEEVCRHVNKAAEVVMRAGYKAVAHFQSRRFAEELYDMDPDRYSYAYDFHGKQGKI